MAKPSFRDQIYEVVASIPKGKVMTYGQISASCGRPRAARIVGGVAHYGDTELPWQRVVKKDGSLAEGYPGGIEGHRAALAAEGVQIDGNYKVNMARHLWQPESV